MIYREDLTTSPSANLSITTFGLRTRLIAPQYDPLHGWHKQRYSPLFRKRLLKSFTAAVQSVTYHHNPDFALVEVPSDHCANGIKKKGLALRNSFNEASITLASSVNRRRSLHVRHSHYQELVAFEDLVGKLAGSLLGFSTAHRVKNYRLTALCERVKDLVVSNACSIHCRRPRLLL